MTSRIHDNAENRNRNINLEFCVRKYVDLETDINKIDLFLLLFIES